MELWIVISAMCIVATGAIILGVGRARGGKNAVRADYDLSVYKDQLGELDRDLERGVIHSILAEDAQGISGYSTIHLNELSWSGHVAALRVTGGESARGLGVWRLLTREAFNIALTCGIEKLIARMTTDQEGARALFHELGFQN